MLAAIRRASRGHALIIGIAARRNPPRLTAVLADNSRVSRLAAVRGSSKYT
jgi:hypothetical protein